MPYPHSSPLGMGWALLQASFAELLGTPQPTLNLILNIANRRENSTRVQWNVGF